MTFTKTLLMALFLVVGGLYVINFEIGGSRGSGRGIGSSEDKPQILFPGLEAKEISRVHVEHGNVSYAFLVTDSANQRIAVLEPLSAPTDEISVKAVLNAITSLQSFNSIDNSSAANDVAAMGLDRPAMKLRFVDKAGEHEVLFGNKHSLTSRRYAQIQGENRVVMVSDDSFVDLKKTPFELRDRTPVAFNPSDVRGLSIVRAGGGLELVFVNADRANNVNDQGEWKFGGEFAAKKVDQAAVKDVFSDLLAVHVAEFIDRPNPNLDTYGLREPYARVKIVTSDGVVNAKFGSVGTAVGAELSEASALTENNYYLQLEGVSTVYKLAKRFPNGLMQDAMHFWDKAPFADLDFDNVTEIAIGHNHEADKFLAFGKVVNASEVYWEILSEKSKGLRVNDRLMQDWFNSIKEAKVLFYLPGGSIKQDIAGFDKPNFEISLLMGNQQQSIRKRIVVGSEVGESLVTKSFNTLGEAARQTGSSSQAPRHAAIEVSGQEPLVFVVDAITLSSLDKTLTHFLGSGSAS